MCNLCNPKRKDWSENGFYGYSCADCKVPDRAFMVFEKHNGELTPEEYKTFNKLCEKYYPQLKSKRLSESRKTCLHWYEFLTK
jgi:hypothetical protein